MSTVLHPVGPEPSQTYWVRRAVVIAAAIVTLAIVIALIVNGSSSGSAVQQPPPVTEAVPVQPSPSPMGTALRTPSALAPTSATPSPSASGSSPAAASPTVTETHSPGPVACDAASLRATLTGKQRLKTNKPNAFTLSLINGTGVTCVVKVSPASYELKIYSGVDRIWSTNDCSTSVKPLTRTLKAEEAVEWKLTWNGRRSRSDCKVRPEIPRPGTYFATSQFAGAKPVQLRMILVG